MKINTFKFSLSVCVVCIRVCVESNSYYLKWHYLLITKKSVHARLFFCLLITLLAHFFLLVSILYLESFNHIHVKHCDKVVHFTTLKLCNTFVSMCVYICVCVSTFFFSILNVRSEHMVTFHM